VEGTGSQGRSHPPVLLLTISTDGSVTGSLDLEPLAGRADSGDLGEDLTDVLVALGEAAHEQERGVVFLMDEIQFLDDEPFEALIAAIHKTVQRQLPITLVGAGLPQLPRLAGEAKSYAERLFRFPRLGPLDERAAADALIEPALNGVEIDSRAVRAVLEYTQGYPYFSRVRPGAWDRAERSPIGPVEAVEAQAIVEARLDEDFFAAARAATDGEVTYPRAGGPAGTTPSAVADQMGRPVQRTQRPGSVDRQGLVYALKRGDVLHGAAVRLVPPTSLPQDVVPTAGSPGVEEPAGRARVRVPMVGMPALGVDVPLVAVALGGDPLEVREEDRLLAGVRQAVGPPHDHRRHAHHAVGDPAVLVLEMPVGDPLRVAQQAIPVAHGSLTRSAVSPTSIPLAANHPSFASIASQ
jgi:hypothetical protein